MKHLYLFLWLIMATWACQNKTDSQSSDTPPPTSEAVVDSALLRFEVQVQEFERQDQVKFPPTGVTLFTGSSSVRLWRTIEGDLKPLPVINRGFGGSTFPELNHYFDRLVLPYRPRLVVVYEGDNDLSDSSATPEEVLAGLHDFRLQMDQKLPHAQLFMLAIKPSPSRRGLLDKVRQTNALMEAYCDTVEKATFLDVFSPMLRPDGEIDGQYFINDSLHMNAKGYERWKEVILEPLLEGYAK